MGYRKGTTIKPYTYYQPRTQNEYNNIVHEIPNAYEEYEYKNNHANDYYPNVSTSWTKHHEKERIKSDKYYHPSTIEEHRRESTGVDNRLNEWNKLPVKDFPYVHYGKPLYNL